MGQYVQAEDWIWTPNTHTYGKRSYRAYLPYPLDGWQPTIGSRIQALLDKADESLQRIDAVTDSHKTFALLNWMVCADECIRTSVIEGVYSTVEGVAWAQYNDRSGVPIQDENDHLTLGAFKQATKSVDLGHRMRDGYQITVDDICDLHNTLFAGTKERSIGGQLRDCPMWIGPQGCSIYNASHVAPPKEHVHELLNDLVNYMNNSEHHPLLQACVVHIQFETIHPFEDGNGRTGRALIHTILNSIILHPIWHGCGRHYCLAIWHFVKLWASG